MPPGVVGQAVPLADLAVGDADRGAGRRAAALLLIARRALDEPERHDRERARAAELDRHGAARQRLVDRDALGRDVDRQHRRGVLELARQREVARGLLDVAAPQGAGPGPDDARGRGVGPPGGLLRDVRRRVERVGPGLGLRRCGRRGRRRSSRPCPRRPRSRRRAAWRRPGRSGAARTMPRSWHRWGPAATHADRLAPMSWQPELDELRRREALAREMGGEERVARQHAQGKLTARERVDRLLDDGSFHETGGLAGVGAYGDDGALEGFTPANMVVGQGRIDARRVVLQADDFTVRGGAADAAIWQKMVWAEQAAHELRQPLVRLVDGTGGGGSVKTLETMGFSYVPPLPGFELVIENLSRVPVVAAALGPCAGLGAARVALSHFSVIVRGSAQMFVAGPAGRRRGDGRVARQGAARRRAGPDAGRRGRQRGGRRGRRPRPAAALPVLPAGQRVGGAPARRADRRSGPARGGAAVDRPARLPPELQDAAHPRARRRPRLAVRGRRALRAPGHHRAGAPRRAPGRRAGLRPDALRRRAHRRRVGQARALRRHVRRLPPARS